MMTSSQPRSQPPRRVVTFRQILLLLRLLPLILLLTVVIQLQRLRLLRRLMTHLLLMLMLLLEASLHRGPILPLRSPPRRPQPLPTLLRRRLTTSSRASPTC